MRKSPKSDKSLQVSTHNILCTRPIAGLDTLQTLLDPHHSLNIEVIDKPLDPKELLVALQGKSGLISMLSDPINKEVIESCPDLKIITNYAVGFNNIDIHTAKEKGIVIGNTPDVLSFSTAETALTLLLNLSRKIPGLTRVVKNGEWKGFEPSLYNGSDLRGKTIAILGPGRIGTEFAKLCKALWNTRVITLKRESLKGDHPFDIVTEEEFFKEADVLSLHMPLNDQSKKLVTLDFIKRFSKPFFLINTARGAICDESDILKALENGLLKGVGLDVTDPEPMSKNSPLLLRDDVIITPHIGSATDKTREEMTRMCLENILSFIQGKPLPYPV